MTKQTNGREPSDEEPIEVSGPTESAWHAVGDPDAADMVAKARLVSALAEAIKAAGLKQGQAAQRLGIPQSNLSRLLSGTFRSVSFDQLFRFLAVMGIDVRVMLAPSRGGLPGGLAVARETTPEWQESSAPDASGSLA